MILLLQYFATKHQKKVILLVSTTGDTGPAAVLMVESEALQLSEEIMLGGVVYGHEQNTRSSANAKTTYVGSNITTTDVPSAAAQTFKAAFPATL